ncbi:SusC/RagA family TonB-linked outer membrane protein [Segatella copri]|uniref:TonB-dependent receptor n=1 Tax=Segatella copri TaxID=165179 RepID=A0AAW9TGJ8_9BACT|nr:TonB-dependent receptor [Segatella copri]MQN27510.1 TonB-dependent receptor [Segatella copri]MQN32831.1 TonB-dependent receptor [Segatella copri]MQN36753.1 TonB-dependent receptor [Segatella copri]MQN75354.1 TonB-dependent receptor [Segatella copri]MQO25410.1 TonB-dependent receptor [Segatella copri]
MKQVKIKLPLRALTLASGLLLTVSSFAQSNAIKGHVKDASGEPIMGATITVNGKAVGITDMDGNFSVDAAPGANLTFTYLGMTPKTIKATSNMMITLVDDQKSLNEVVVIGYGRAKKNDLTGSVTAIKPDEMSKGITSSASDMLVGKIAGVDVQTGGGQPGTGAQIRIRGGASLNASNDPLYVIDGLAIDNNTNKGMSNVLAMINPNDIESFTVLKDASATAIYGSRASNGVIIITTKKGRSGQKPSVTYNGDVTLSTIQKKYEVMNASEYKQALTNLGIDTNGLGTADTDWQDEIFRTAISTNHNVSIQGGLKNMPYRVSLGFEDNNGIVKTTWMKRFNTSINVAPTFLDKHLNVNFTAKYMFEKDRYAKVGDAIGGALTMDPTQPVRVDDAAYECVGGYFQYLQAKDDKVTDPSWTSIAKAQMPQNPVAVLDNYKCIAKSNDISGNLEVDYKIHGFEDLHLHAAIGAQYTDGKQDETSSKYSYSNNYFGYYGYDHAYKYSIEGKAFAEYAHKFGVHDIDIMAGAEQSHYHRTGYNYGAGIDEYLRDNNPLYETTEGKWNYEHDPVSKDDEMWRTHNSLVSYFGRLNYNLLDRYLFTATFRADGSSRFRKGKKWGYFPAAAFAWKINNEPFLKDAKWLDELKLRLGWGKTGQQNGIDDFYYSTLYRVSNGYAQYPFGDNYYQTLRPTASNQDLTWEKTTTYNAGLDFTALNGRFGVNVDGYYRKTTDLLASVAIAGGTNFGDQLLKNIGSLENYGIELAFNVKPIVTKDFIWDVTYNVGWNHNEITELEAGLQDWVWTGDKVSRGNNTKIQVNKVGQPINSYYVYQQVYDENGKPIEGAYVDRNGNGTIDDDDRYCYKSPAPDVIMGLTTKFIYKNWDFSAAFHASIGNYVYYDFLNSKAVLNEINASGAFRNTTTEAVNLGFTGTATNPTNTSDYFVRNASYLKCSNMTLGYSFPALIKVGAEKICSGRIFFTVQNPFIITKYKGIDPEVSNGIDSNPYPRPISFQLGLNLNF